jgi:hypothetical protein
VVKGKGAVDLRCGGADMIAHGESGTGGAPAAGHDGGSLMGKRYADDDAGIEVLITKAGAGSLSIGDTPLPLKEAKALPSSD